ncbi:putative lipoprotein YiaD [Pseudomonas reidholzensis]|uniref:Putative lipoprotein YiaD n=1 Tax=Pseudomonas reidholzensis TaxID=1785162 RepID=A0A383RYW4_9PSED|nr:OmpA family protein [Pseudomonas reidholzensis]SYX91953.1 putative lipoprotein YiaD [Pseudomonas reidholzensis]
MTHTQIQGLWLWAGVVAVALLSVLPLATGWRAIAIATVLAAVAVNWRRARRHPISPSQTRLAQAGSLPSARYREPVLLVCGDGMDDLFEISAAESPALRLSEQGCYLRVPADQSLSEMVADVLALRPQWHGQLGILFVVAPGLHTDEAALADRLGRLSDQLARVRNGGVDLPLLLVSYLEASQQAGTWFSWEAGQARALVREAGMCSSLGTWQREAASTQIQAARLQLGVRVNGVAQWFADSVIPHLVTQNRDLPGRPPTAFAVALTSAVAEQVPNNLWQRWLRSRCALITPETKATVRTEQLPLPDPLLHLLYAGSPRPRQYRVQVLGGWLLAVAGTVALLSSAWQNTLLARQVSDDLRRYWSIPVSTDQDDRARRSAALAVLGEAAARLDHYYRQGEPWSLGFGLYQGEKLRAPVLATLAGHRQPAMAHVPPGAALPVRLDSLSLFSSGSAQLKPEATKVLIEALVGIKAQPGWLIVIAGHTDATGTAEHNLRLSKARATAVHEWLRRMGDIPDSCFAVQGLGANQPLASNDTEHGRTANRRVEIRLVPEPGACVSSTSAADAQPLSHFAAFNF